MSEMMRERERLETRFRERMQAQTDAANRRRTDREVMRDDLLSHTKSELQDLCRARGLPTSGLKIHIAERLVGDSIRAAAADLIAAAAAGSIEPAAES